MQSTASYQLDDTIAAIATAQGGAARAIIRLAGPDVARCLSACFESEDANRTIAGATHAQVFRGRVALAEFGRHVPCDLYYWPDQRSFTRSPLAELHLLGSPPLASATLRTLVAHNARLARPGEFTLRAFLAGRLDLTQAEAVLGVVDAGNRQEFDVALRQLAGGLSGPLTQIRDQLLDLLAHVEAGLDFVEEDIQFIDPQHLVKQLTDLHRNVRDIADQMKQRTMATDAIRVVLVGLANVGKSSLFNRIVDRANALVSAEPGTTRDYLSAHIDLDGVVCELIDTAGADEVAERATISAAAQRMMQHRAAEAHIQLLCLDATQVVHQRETIPAAADRGQHQLIVLTKCDAATHDALSDRRLLSAIKTSSHEGTGIEELRGAIRELATDSATEPGGVVTATANRCRDSLVRTATAVQQAQDAARDGHGEEIVAAELRAALDELGIVVGTVYTDDLMDRIFSRFCIGK